ncbi:Zn-dependent peptidase ImmA, M78 family [Curtobacterium sp. YR515]|nr:Zn-dependent peptidase ImmA, M78 family [Curtobacterium sp. YR515]
MYAGVLDDLSPRASLLETVRLSRGLTQTALAEVSGVSQGTLSKVETGLLDLDPERWAAVADALGVPVEAFLEARAAIVPARVFHRKKKSTPKGALTKIGADAALMQQRADAILGHARSELRRHDLEDGFVTPQEVAQDVRSELRLGQDPISDLIATVEAAGVAVLRWPLESLQVDAIATWPAEGRPVVLVGEHVPAERQRFTIAHELGHAVMHNDAGGDEQERQADAFAGEFLLPGRKLRVEWPADPSLETLLPLKRRWKISLAALIRRAQDEALIDDRTYREWSIRLSTSGMHRREPDPIPIEQPQALTKSIAAALDGGTTIDQLARKAHMLPQEFSSTFMEEHA